MSKLTAIEKEHAVQMYLDEAESQETVANRVGVTKASFKLRYGSTSTKEDADSSHSRSTTQCRLQG